MATSVQEKMKQLEGLQTEDKDLNQILRSTEAQTQEELAKVAKDSRHLGEYLKMNQELAVKINTFLERNQTYGEKFQALIKAPSKGGLGRLLRATPVIGRAFGSTFSPIQVSQVIMDMYTNMVLQKDAVAKQLGLIESRRDLLFTEAENAAHDLEVAAEHLDTSSAKLEELTKKYEVALAVSENNGIVGETDLSALTEYFSALDIAEGTTLTRINLAKLTQLVENLNQQKTESDEERTRYEIDLNAANSAIKGFRVQQEQFNAYVKTTKVLLYGLETHLKYSKTIAENQAILAGAQETAIKALQAFGEYQDAINATFVLNAMGVQVMAQETAQMLSKDMYDEAALSEAKDRVKQANAYWDGFRNEYTQKAEDLMRKVKESKEPTQ